MIEQQQKTGLGYIATYTQGILSVEVPASETRKPQTIADYIRRCGIPHVRVYPAVSHDGITATFLKDTPFSTATMDMVTASSLDEMITLASAMIKGVDNVKIDGIPLTDSQPLKDDEILDVLDEIVSEITPTLLLRNKN